jgi:hypothetical protein
MASARLGVVHGRGQQQRRRASAHQNIFRLHAFVFGNFGRQLPDIGNPVEITGIEGFQHRFLGFVGRSERVFIRVELGPQLRGSGQINRLIGQVIKAVGRHFLWQRPGRFGQKRRESTGEESKASG